MSKFEIVIIFSPELGNQSLEKEINFFKELITSNTGKIINVEDWGLRDLSYSIKKFQKAFYKFFQVEMNGEKINAIKKDLNQSENILRYIFIKVKDHEELPTKLKYEKN